MEKEQLTKVVYGSHSFILVDGNLALIVNNKELRNVKIKRIKLKEYRKELLFKLQERDTRDEKERIEILCAIMQMAKRKQETSKSKFIKSYSPARKRYELRLLVRNIQKLINK